MRPYIHHLGRSKGSYLDTCLPLALNNNPQAIQTAKEILKTISEPTMIWTKIQFRHVINDANDANVSSWINWLEVGTFASEEDVMNALTRIFESKFVDVSFDQIGIYQSFNTSNRILCAGDFQFRFCPAPEKIQSEIAWSVEPSPWKVGLNEA